MASLGLLTVALGCVAASGLAMGLAAQRAPTELERILQGRYLDRYYLLRSDVKVRVLQSRRVVRSTTHKKGEFLTTRPITMVTPEGVFYSADYDQTRLIEQDVRPGIDVSGDPVKAEEMQPLGRTQTGDVVELSGEPKVVLRQGDLARVIGVEEGAGGYRVTLEGFSAEPVEVLFRPSKTTAADSEARAAGFAAMLNRIAYVLPEDPAERARWIDPSWSESVRSAIRQGRAVEGMTPLQVLLAWGTPVYVTRQPETSGEVWLFQRGETLRDQLRNRTHVYFSGGRVSSVEESSLP